MADDDELSLLTPFFTQKKALSERKRFFDA
jgi:hypothetical protein